MSREDNQNDNDQATELRKAAILLASLPMSDATFLASKLDPRQLAQLIHIAKTQAPPSLLEQDRLAREINYFGSRASDGLQRRVGISTFTEPTQQQPPERNEEPANETVQDETATAQPSPNKVVGSPPPMAIRVAKTVEPERVPKFGSIKRATQGPESIPISANTNSTNPFAEFVDATPERLAKLLDDERPQTIATVLAYLAPDLAAETLGLFSSETQVAATMHIASMDEPDGEVIGDLAEALHEQMQRRITPPVRPIGGTDHVLSLIHI